MAAPAPPSCLRGARVVVALCAGLLLSFGGVCGVGPTSLSLLAVTSNQVPSPDDARSQVPLPMASETSSPSRRVLRRAAEGVRRVRRHLSGVRVVQATRDGLAHLRAPPLRGPPALAA